MSGLAIADGIGMLGVALIVVAYLLLQVERIDAQSVSFSLVNALGAAAIIYSLCYDFNLSALVIEGFWLVISLYGVVRALRGRRKHSR